MDQNSDEFEEIEVIDLDDAQDAMEDTLDTEDFDEVEHPEVPDLSKLTFTKHSKSVFCGDLSKDGATAATGGEDDSAFIWSRSDGGVMFECTGHKDSITSVAFNHDGQLLATGDMSGMIQVWDVKDKKLTWCCDGDDMEWLTWHPKTNILMSGRQSGEIYIWQIPHGHCKILPSHGSSCTCGKLLPDGRHIIAGYEDGQVKLWDIKLTTAKWQFSDVHTSSVTSLELSSDGTLCSVAPSSNLIKMQDGKAIATLLIQGEKDIETHMFSNELNLLITGSLTGQICVWDVSTKAIRHRAKLEYGVTVAKLGPSDKAFIGSTDGAVYVCDVRTGVLCEVLTGHGASILSLCLSVNDSCILTTSDDATAKIFPIN